jgi:hypothetical protein
MPKPAIKKTLTLKDLRPVIANHQTKIVQEVKVILKHEVQSLFDNFPEIEAIRWTQRRPLESPESAPVHKSDFHIDNVEYRLSDGIGPRSVPFGNPALNDCGFDKRDTEWVSPWNDSRLDNVDLLDSFTVFEEHLFDAHDALALAIGDYDCVTVTREAVILQNS